MCFRAVQSVNCHIALKAMFYLLSITYQDKLFGIHRLTILMSQQCTRLITQLYHQLHLHKLLSLK